MAPKSKARKIVPGKLTAGQFFELVANKVGLKKRIVRDTMYAAVDTAITTLIKNGEVKIPHLAKFMIKTIPEKRYPAGDYTNFFKKGPDGKPVVEHREARVRPAKTRIKVSLSSQIRKPVLSK